MPMTGRPVAGQHCVFSASVGAMMAGLSHSRPLVQAALRVQQTGTLGK
jgi:hypothetical protein